jgi:hypothetical protein
MVRYIDLALTIDARRSRQRLGWQPRPRLLALRRIPFMVENLKSDPVEWHRRNQAAMKQVRLRENLQIYRLLEKHYDRIGRELIRSLKGEGQFPTYRKVKGDILEWRYAVVIRHLMNAIRTGDKGVFTTYCRDLALRRHKEGFSAGEVCAAIERLNSICLRRLGNDPESEGLKSALDDHISMTVQFGCDQIHETFEEMAGYEEDSDLLGGAAR